ncbi:monothiol glutaredoxin-4 [Metarhizium album ARSEF 1941]|uniref:Monothiol glutaredoxin-4 n=1 Tax=Metarhizium album (strain ARSEF 1941) TaxID=1081103 RepID=A0A0B2WYN8_METAS|nr:monothiol glutaredoxin-4 [Metarhizium album ARSEF 1941]KHN98542.1 monothiol glutaredoxin-4 [Metarhizium album ARSEF 1941]
MSVITEITTQAQWDETLASLPSSTLLIISFHAPWAAPCAQMATVLSTLASEYPVTEPLSTKWVSINAEELSDISEAYDVTAVPFLVLVRNGRIVETVSGSSAIKVRAAIETNAQNNASASSAPVNGANQTNAQGTKTVDASVDPEKQKEELFKRLGDLVKAAPVMLFMKGTPSDPQCGFSRQMVAILRENSVKYGFFNILADDEVRQGLKEFAEWPTYPQLWIDGELVGGLDIVKEEMGNNEDFFKPYAVGGIADAASEVSWKTRWNCTIILESYDCDALEGVPYLLGNNSRERYQKSGGSSQPSGYPRKWDSIVTNEQYKQRIMTVMELWRMASCAEDYDHMTIVSKCREQRAVQRITLTTHQIETF